MRMLPRIHKLGVSFIARGRACCSSDRGWSSKIHGKSGLGLATTGSVAMRRSGTVPVSWLTVIALVVVIGLNLALYVSIRAAYALEASEKRALQDKSWRARALAAEAAVSRLGRVFGYAR